MPILPSLALTFKFRRRCAATRFSSTPSSFGTAPFKEQEVVSDFKGRRITSTVAEGGGGVPQPKLGRGGSKWASIARVFSQAQNSASHQEMDVEQRVLRTRALRFVSSAIVGPPVAYLLLLYVQGFHTTVLGHSACSTYTLG